MLLSVHLVPNASRTKIVSWREGILKIRLAAAPVENKANRALLRFLAKVFDLPPSRLSIVHGQTSKKKIVAIPLAEKELSEKLLKNDEMRRADPD